MNAPMIPRGRRPLGAHVTGYAAVWAWNILGDKATDSIRHHLATGRPDIAQQIADAAAELREAARQHLEAGDLPPVSGRGNAEAEILPAPAVSELPGSGFSGFQGEVDVRAAALVLSVSPRRVRQLLEVGDLSGRQDGTGRWSVDHDDLHRLAADRRITA